jgi:HAD superfamily phosphatase (TIGR01681 family)
MGRPNLPPYRRAISTCSEHHGGTTVKLIEALTIIRASVPPGASRFAVYLACGITPLHLQTFLTAQLRALLPGHDVTVRAGLFGDLAGNLERAALAESDAVVVVLEWSDIDPRLGHRGSGGCRPQDLEDVLATGPERLARLEKAVCRLSPVTRVVCALPTLPLPPLFMTGPDQSSVDELRLRAYVASFAAAIAAESSVHILASQTLDASSPLQTRLSVSSDLATGFPYQVPHASALAGMLARLAVPVPPKKGLITDLDDTLWAGVVGEAGPEGVSWTLDEGNQLHGLYQQCLASLATMGVLVGVASKNEWKSVEAAFRRPDILLPAASIHPFEVNWGPKSASVRKILDVWNIGPDAVVFVDDSPLEIAEVQAAFPEIECVLFPHGQPDALMSVLALLRRRFGRSRIGREDVLRADSIRAGAAVRAAGTAGPAADSFLKSLAGRVTITPEDGRDLRPVELLTEAAWRVGVGRAGGFALSASYRDKLGALGKIATIAGRRVGTRLEVDHWVMSCRAFSRRIEHHCLRYLFDHFRVEEVVLHYAATARNGVLRDFLEEVTGAAPESGPLAVPRVALHDRLPPLLHAVEEGADALA